MIFFVVFSRTNAFTLHTGYNFVIKIIRKDMEGLARLFGKNAEKSKGESLEQIR